MTRKAGIKAKKEDSLVKAMDGFATKLIEDNNKDTIPLATRLDVFKALTGWVSVKNRIAALNPDDPEGAELDGYRNRIAAPKGETAERAPRYNGRAGGLATAAKRWGSERDDDAGGSALDAIKARLPVPSSIDGDGDRNGG